MMRLGSVKRGLEVVLMVPVGRAQIRPTPVNKCTRRYLVNLELV